MKQLLLLCIALIGIAHTSFCQANTKLSNLVSPVAVNQHLLPNTTNARDLGSSSYAFRNTYLRGDLFLDGTRFLSNHPGTASYNAFVGSSSGRSVTSGKYNTVIGHNALYKDTSGSYNTVFGAEALYSNSNGSSNIAVGYRSLNRNTTGGSNIGIGSSALYTNTSGYSNIAIGTSSLYNNTTGFYNTATGTYALNFNTIGNYNTANGLYALFLNATGSFNTASGFQAMNYNTIGSDNAGFGSNALLSNESGNGNTALGVAADVTSYWFSNATAIGYYSRVDAPNKVRIGNTSVTSIGGQVGWTTFSDGRYKQEVKEVVQGLGFINSLRPLAYTVDVKGLEGYYNKGRKRQEGHTPSKEGEAAMKEAQEKASKIIHTGFIAQEVEEAARKLKFEFSGIDKPQQEGGLYGIRYADFVVPLVKAVQEVDAKESKLEEENKQLRKELDELKQMVLELKRGSLSNGAALSAASLESSMPNPAKGSTVIGYNVPVGTKSAHLLITDMKGSVVKQILLNSRGSSTITLNTAALPAGVYNYTLWVAGREVDTKQLLIIH